MTIQIKNTADMTRVIRAASEFQDNFDAPQISTRRQAPHSPPVSPLDTHDGDVAIDRQSDDDRHPDARLIALGREHQRLVTVWLPLWREMDRLRPFVDVAVRNVQRAAGLRPLARGELLSAYAAASHATGHAAAVEASNNALDSADEVANQIRAIPAQTFAGVLVKARVLMDVVIPAKDMEAPAELQNWEVQCFYGFLAELERMAGRTVKADAAHMHGQA